MAKRSAVWVSVLLIRLLCGFSVFALSIVVLAGQTPQAPADLLKEAEAFHRAGKLDQAINDYKLFLEKYPDVPQVRSDLGAALAGAGRYEEAIAEYQQALPLDPLPEIQLNLSLAYYKIGKLSLAVDGLKKVREEMPNDLRPVLLLADCYLRLGENKQVIELLDSLGPTHGDDLAFIYMLGTALVRDGQTTRGQIIIDKILKNGDSAEARLLMGTTKLNVSDYPGALADLQKAVELNPNLPDVYSYYGLALMSTGDQAGAQKAFEQAIKNDPNSFESNLRMGVLLRENQDYGAAIQYMRHALDVRPGDLGVRYQIAAAELSMGQVERARSDLEAIVKEAPNFTEAHVSLATACYRDKRKAEGDRERAIVTKQLAEKQATEKGVKEEQVSPRLPDHKVSQDDNAEARFLLGKRFYESRNYPAAVKELGAAVELNSSLPKLQSFYGLALLNTGDPEAAAAAFRRELAANPNEFVSNLTLGQILTASYQWNEAVPLLERALRLRPKSTDAMTALGQCLSGVGKLKEARESLEVVTQAAPKSLEAHQALLSVYTRLHLAREAGRERAIVNRLQKGRSAGNGRATINAMAPDFELADLAAKKKVRLGDFRGKTPVVLVFGSYTCPNFRSAATALTSVYQHYGNQVPFFLVYIREAHATDNWQSTRNEREGIAMAPASTMEEKQDHAAVCSLKLHLQFPALVDGIDGSVEAAYAAWPSRAFVIGTDGRVLYSSGLNQQDFRAEEMERSLRAAITSK